MTPKSLEYIAKRLTEGLQDLSLSTKTVTGRKGECLDEKKIPQ